MQILTDALPAVVAFLLISLLTFIGWGIRRLYLFSIDIKHIIEKEMTNGKPPGEGESTKDIMQEMRDALVSHHEWAQGDAKERNRVLKEHNDKLDRIRERPTVEP